MGICPLTVCSREGRTNADWAIDMRDSRSYHLRRSYWTYLCVYVNSPIESLSCKILVCKDFMMSLASSLAAVSKSSRYLGEGEPGGWLGDRELLDLCPRGVNQKRDSIRGIKGISASQLLRSMRGQGEEDEPYGWKMTTEQFIGGSWEWEGDEMMKEHLEDHQ